MEGSLKYIGPQGETLQITFSWYIFRREMHMTTWPLASLFGTT